MDIAGDWPDTGCAADMLRACVAKIDNLLRLGPSQVFPPHHNSSAGRTQAQAARNAQCGGRLHLGWAMRSHRKASPDHLLCPFQTFGTRSEHTQGSNQDHRLRKPRDFVNLTFFCNYDRNYDRNVNFSFRFFELAPLG